MKITLGKYSLQIFLQVSNLTFDPCFKVELGQDNIKALYVSYWSLGFELFLNITLISLLLNTWCKITTRAVVSCLLYYGHITYVIKTFYSDCDTFSVPEQLYSF